MIDSCPEEFIVLAGRLADAAGDLVRQYFRRPLAIVDKADESPVTMADREAEARMRDMITRQFPDHGLIGEEHGPDRPDAEFVWVLDPIDGTKAFISGVPVFGVLIALLHDGHPVLGVIDQPISRERWVGAAGHATTMNGAEVRTAPRGELADCVLWSTSPHMFDGDPAASTAFGRLREAVKFVHYGGECYQYGMLASGFIDIVVEDDMRAYDYCALVPVVQGAGGIITDWRGAALGLQSGGKVLAAADADLHARVLPILQD
ncbi:MAG: histidinol-phosphatase [Rhodospirillales bacterium]|nr:MAG: histidinol-phosphatase [Rhodospirillales bacterium]